MQLNNYLKSKMHFIGAFSLLFGLASCGSYQYVSQNEDSIYGSSERNVEYQEETVKESSPKEGSSYYQNYFKEKSQELDNGQDDIYFTDIDTYEGGYDVENDSLEYQGGYTGWGQDNDDVTINIYGGGLNSGIFWNRPFYPSWRWNYGYGYGNIYGYGYGFNDYWCPPYYGSIYAGWNSWNYRYPFYYGYGNGFYGNYYNRYYGNYSRRSLAYNSGRRGSLYNNSNLTGRTINRRSVTNRRVVANRSVTSRRSTATRSSSRLNSSDAANRPRRTVGNSTTRTRVNSTRTRPRTTTTRPRTSTTRPRTTTTRPRTSTRTRSSNNSSVNRSRSSSNVRSSNNSSRSSSRSSGRSSSSRRGKN